MPRLPKYDVSSLNPAQAEAYRRIIDRRGFMPAPHGVWVLRPGLAGPASEVGWHVQSGEALPPRLFELAILLIARHWRAEYAWQTHAGRAVKAGLPEAVMDALRQDRVPEFAAADEAVVYEFVTRLHADKEVSDDLYGRALALLGLDGVIDLTGLIGFFSLIAATIKVFEIQPPA